jgi:hypothetical protein
MAAAAEESSSGGGGGGGHQQPTMSPLDYADELSQGLSQTTANQIASELGVSPLLLANRRANSVSTGSADIEANSSGSSSNNSSSSSNGINSNGTGQEEEMKEEEEQMALAWTAGKDQQQEMEHAKSFGNQQSSNAKNSNTKMMPPKREPTLAL